MTAPADVSPGDFRAVLGRYATGVTVVTTRTPEGEPVGLTVNSFTSVSLAPPLVLFCLDLEAGSLPAFQSAEGFAVNILRAVRPNPPTDALPDEAGSDDEGIETMEGAYRAAERQQSCTAGGRPAAAGARRAACGTRRSS